MNPDFRNPGGKIILQGIMNNHYRKLTNVTPTFSNRFSPEGIPARGFSKTMQGFYRKQTLSEVKHGIIRAKKTRKMPSSVECQAPVSIN